MGHKDKEGATSSHKKRHRDGHSKHSSKKRRREEEDDEEMQWVEKSVQEIPTSTTGTLTSNMLPSSRGPSLPGPSATQTKLERDEWMLEPGQKQNVVDRPATTSSVAQALHSGGTFRVGSMPDRRDWGTREAEDFTEGFGTGDAGIEGALGGDFFSSLGTLREKKPAVEKPDPARPMMSRNELNTKLFDADGRRKDDPAPTGLNLSPSSVSNRPKNEPGSAGWDWRMKRLQRTYETAEDEGRSVEEVAMERYGSIEAFNEAQDERRFIDERDARRRGEGRGVDASGPGVDEFGREIRRPETPTPVAQAGRFMINRGMDSTASSRPSSSRGSSFRKPGERAETPHSRAPTKPSTPVPSVFTPPASRSGSGLLRGPQTAADDAPASMSATELNRLQAKVLKAKLTGAPDAADLESRYNTALASSHAHVDPSGDAKEVRALPTLDAQGRLYDVGVGTGSPASQPSGPGNRKRKEAQVQTHDPSTGELLRYNADDDTTTLQEMVRQERFSAGIADQKNMDAEFASRIAGDARFDADLDYIDDNAEQLARKKLRTDAQKRMFAINDYARTQRALDTCPYCFPETASKPRVPVVALATRAYLALPQNEGMVDGHCLIVPLQHHLSLLEADDDTWEEIRVRPHQTRWLYKEQMRAQNFMKTLMQAFAARDQGVVFFETVISLRQQRHSVIECMPVPWEIYEECPAYFREGILAAENEWTQHKKLIDFSARPGGFRRALVPNVPYFAVMWDYRCDKGYGHVIEGVDKNNEDEDAYDVDENARTGASEFSRTFAQETLGQMMQLEPRRWRRPKRLGAEFDTQRAKTFQQTVYVAQYDWTRMLAEQQ